MSFTGQWKRNACCTYDQDDVPAPPQNLLVFEVSGYIYRTIPVWFSESGLRMTPIQFSASTNHLYYRFTFYKPQGSVCNNVYHFSTSDDIVPVIREVVSGKVMRVKRLTRHNGYTNWVVMC